MKSLNSLSTQGKAREVGAEGGGQNLVLTGILTGSGEPS